MNIDGIMNFRCLCIRDIKAYSTALGRKVSYYHDRYGLEADCVLHLADGRYALIEFKLGSREIEEGARHLCQLRQLIRERSAAKHTNMHEPELMMVVTGGEMAYSRPDGVLVIPIGTLKDQSIASKSLVSVGDISSAIGITVGYASSTAAILPLLKGRCFTLYQTTLCFLRKYLW